MDRKTLVGGAVVAGVLAVGVYELTTAGDDDRPIIKVRGGSVILESVLPWEKDLIGLQWKPDHQTGEDVEQFVVRVENAAGTCQEMTGGTVRVMYGRGEAERLEFYRRRKHGVFTLEPKVDSPQSLAMDNASTPKTLTLGNATFNRVQVIEGSAGGSCNLTAESVITICMNNCS